MADTITANLALVKPEVGQSRDVWGDKLNANMDKLDTVVFPRKGAPLEGPVSSLVKDHGTLGSVTEPYSAKDANTHSVTVNGAHVISPTDLVEGLVMQVNILYTSGSVAVTGATQWELGGGAKSSDIAAVGVTLVAGAAYRIVFEVVRGVRTGVFQ